MKKAIIFLAMVILTIACTKSTSSLKSSSEQSDVVNKRHPIGVYKVCFNTNIVDTPYYRIVLRYETSDLIPTGYVTYTTSKGVLVDSIPLPPYSRHLVIDEPIYNESDTGYIQIISKGVVDTTLYVDGSVMCSN